MDKNFAVHLPVLDRLFGTYYLPEGRWPAAYGIAGGGPLPEGYARQFTRRSSAADAYSTVKPCSSTGIRRPVPASAPEKVSLVVHGLVKGAS